MVGAMSVPGGGMQTDQRLQAIADNDVTVVCCAPAYALRLADEADRPGMDLAGSNVRATVHAGELGASIPAIRARIYQAVDVHCFYYTGMTALGVTGLSCHAHACVHLPDLSFCFFVIY